MDPIEAQKFADAVKSAAQANNTNETQRLLQTHTQFATAKLLEPALLKALQDGYVDLTELLLIHVPSLKNYITVDKSAIAGAHIPILECLLRHGWNVNGCLDHLGNVLGYAITLQGQKSMAPEVVIWLLEHGAHPDRGQGSDPLANTPLELACLYNATPDIISLLIAKGATVNGTRALCLAAGEGDVDALRLLVEEGGADVNFLCGVSDNNTYGDNDAVRSVKDSIDEEEKLTFRTALHSAAEEGQVDSIIFLLSKGARRDIRNAAGLLPKETAEKFGHCDCVELLDLIVGQ